MTQDTDTNTPSPTRSPTPTPAADDGDDGSDVGGVVVTVSNKVGLNEWWYAVVLTVGSVAVDDVGGLSVSSVEMRCNSCDSWETGVAQWDYYKFDSNPPYDAPFDFRITANGQTVTSEDVISSLDEGDSGSMSAAFSLDAAYTERLILEGDDGEGVHWTAVLAVALCAALVLSACVVFFVCGSGRDRKWR